MLEMSGTAIMRGGSNALCHTLCNAHQHMHTQQPACTKHACQHVLGSNTPSNPQHYRAHPLAATTFLPPLLGLPSPRVLTGLLRLLRTPLAMALTAASAAAASAAAPTALRGLCCARLVLLCGPASASAGPAFLLCCCCCWSRPSCCCWRRARLLSWKGKNAVLAASELLKLGPAPVGKVPLGLKLPLTRVRALRSAPPLGLCWACEATLTAESSASSP